MYLMRVYYKAKITGYSGEISSYRVKLAISFIVCIRNVISSAISASPHSPAVSFSFQLTAYVPFWSTNTCLKDSFLWKALTNRMELPKVFYNFNCNLSKTNSTPRVEKKMDICLLQDRNVLLFYSDLNTWSHVLSLVPKSKERYFVTVHRNRILADIVEMYTGFCKKYKY